MKNQPTRLLALIAVLLVAGCAQESAPSAPVASSASDPASVETSEATAEETGDVQGTVVDDSTVPIGNVTITLDDGTHSTTTGDDGTFSLGFVPAGLHDLHASKDGYVNASLRLEVVAGETQEVRVTLVAAGNAAQFVETQIKSGMVVCALGVRNPATNLVETITPCNAVEGVEKLKVRWLVPTWDNITGVWVETTWTSTQALGDGMSVNWWIVLTDGSIRGGVGRYGGKDPLAHAFSREKIEEHFVGSTGKTLDQCSGSKGCGLESWHANSPSALGSTYPVDVSVMINQEFDEYMTYFHRIPLPPTFSALPK